MNTTHTIKLSDYVNNAAAVEAAILLSARDVGARAVLQSEDVDDFPGDPELADLRDRLLAESDQQWPDAFQLDCASHVVDSLRFHGHTSAGLPWEVVLL